MDSKNELFMQRAFEMAMKGMESNAGGPFGCVIVKDGKIIAEAHNEVTSSNDPTAHAEVTAIRRACKELNEFQLQECIIYTSCEPCPMCLGAIYWARPAKVYYACTKNDAANINFDDQFIYRELDINLRDRKIPFHELSREEGLKVFEQWEEKGDKTLY